MEKLKKNSNIILSPLIACICEGGAETAIINILLDNNLLIFTRDQLIEEKILSCRRAKDFEQRYLKKSFSEQISVIRILDSHSENFKLSKPYKNKINVINVITAPEIEMLIILNEGKYKEYMKKRNTTKPSEFCKEILPKRNIKSKEFVYEYFSNTYILIKAIREYKRVKKMKTNEKCLSDLLK